MLPLLCSHCLEAGQCEPVWFTLCGWRTDHRFFCWLRVFSKITDMHEWGTAPKIGFLLPQCLHLSSMSAPFPFFGLGGHQFLMTEVSLQYSTHRGNGASISVFPPRSHSSARKQFLPHCSVTQGVWIHLVTPFWSFSSVTSEEDNKYREKVTFHYIKKIKPDNESKTQSAIYGSWFCPQGKEDFQFWRLNWRLWNRSLS